MANIRIPNIVKHACIAIYREGGISARSPKDRFVQSFKIARSRLQEYGFVIVGGQDLLAPIALTTKGRSAEMRHKREGRAKSVLFDTLFDKFDIEGKKAAEEKRLREEAAAKLAAKQEAVEADRKAAKKAPPSKRTNGRKPR